MTSTAKIFRELLIGEHRLACPSRLFGARFIYVESFVFDIAGSLSENYDGGCWDFYAISNGGFYMTPALSQSFWTVADNGFQGDLSADAFGLTCSLYAYSLLSGSQDTDFARQCADQYGFMRTYASELDESKLILRALD